MHFDNFDNSHNSFLWPEYVIDFSCARWIPFKASTSVLCLHYRPVTVQCSTKHAYTSKITFLALNPCKKSTLYFHWKEETVNSQEFQKMLNSKIAPGSITLLIRNTIMSWFKINPSPHKYINCFSDTGLAIFWSPHWGINPPDLMKYILSTPKH